MGGHGHDEPYYMHSKHMYNLDRMKNQKLTMTHGVFIAFSVGAVVPIYAVIFQQRKTASAWDMMHFGSNKRCSIYHDNLMHSPPVIYFSCYSWGKSNWQINFTLSGPLQAQFNKTDSKKFQIPFIISLIDMVP